ncbi:IS4 family transposase [Cystobacter ferrugineus]|uniref:Transposase n=1 Tax=Cystobacter ferrugineus TaxID=83449 RepID=A0A1L9B4E4_9BACT|nr:IS4 family transposase [Cystobacter ferrugineus]OJH37114.1 transposase [Cystobacter ferrugineus]
MRKPRLNEQQVHSFLESLFEKDLHAKRILSLSHAVLGVIHAAGLGIHTIAKALAWARGTRGKHGVKQVDRMLSNQGINVWELFALWVPYVLGQRDKAVVALDWTDFDADGQTTLVASLVASHGRTTPLVWHTLEKAALEGMRNETEDFVLQRLREVVPEGVGVIVLADRGFGDQKFYALLVQLKFDYVVRFLQCIQVMDEHGEKKSAGEWVPETGRALRLVGARLTHDEAPVPAVVCVKKKGMEDAWCLATSLKEATAAFVVGLYGKRFRTEETFRDVKDLRFGMGLSWVRVSSPERRDRLLLVSALACGLLTLLGAAGESLGMERYLKCNAVKTRTYSLFRQGCEYYQAIPMMPEEQLMPLLERFAQILGEQPIFREVFGPI